MKFNSELIKSLFRKIPAFDTQKGIHKNGDENNYPELVEALVANSVTASRCKRLMSSYIAGRGYGDELNKITVNEKKGITLLRFLQDVSDSIAEHRGVFIHVNYNLNYEITEAIVLPFSDCRVGRKDSNRYAGKIIVCDDWSDQKSVRNSKKVDVFNPDKKVIESQIQKAGSIHKYNGQILFYHLDKYTYPLSTIHPALEDVDSEKQTSIFKNVSLRKGFFGKMLVVTPPMVDDNLEEDSEDLKRQKTERENFRESLQEFMGAEYSDGVLHFEMEFATDKLEESILFKNIESNINDKLFAHTETTVGQNIMTCFRCPSALVRPQDTKSFSNNGGEITAAKIAYQDEVEFERLNVEQVVARIMKHHKNNPKQDLLIKPLVTAPEPTQNKK